MEKKVTALVGCCHNNRFIKELLARDDSSEYIVIDCSESNKDFEEYLKDHSKVISRVLWSNVERDWVDNIEKAINICVSKQKSIDRIEESLNYDIHSNVLGYRQLENLDMILAMAQRTLLNQLSFIDLLNKISLITEFWNNILNKNNCTQVLFANIPHSFSDYILAETANINTNIENIFVLNRLWLNEWSFLIEYKTKRYLINRDSSSMQERITAVNSLVDALMRKKTWKHNYGIKSNPVNTYLAEQKRGLLNSFLHDNGTILTGLRQRVSWYERVSTSYSIIRKLKNYIYFPLHYQPEATTNPLGMPFFDQRVAIREIKRRYPRNPIVVKEHPMSFLNIGTLSGPDKYIKQNFEFRSEHFYASISGIKDVYLVRRDISSDLLMDNAYCTAGIGGTELLKSIIMGRNTCILSDISPLKLIEGKEKSNYTNSLAMMHFRMFCHDCKPIGDAKECANYLGELLEGRGIEFVK